ncbi:haloacid dehalogenase [Rhodanobacter sp. B04]|uniref:HAD family hydrolase n=1 Tax=Rhodanobacter sp. B04 TaxID=1945860 RepID=UPI000984EDCE|nr:HAD family hydrolase [Rhodanobacter sp. B04]OOG62530.1 haloacid dehalogenase [Rhodanobacter sp. B04]
MLSDKASGVASVAFLLDVDNTLLDNDRFAADLGNTLEQAFGAAERDRYWAIYAQLRDELGYADYLGALQRFRAGLDNDPSLLQMSAYLLEYPFADRLYPHALDTIAHLRTLGPTAILSDGDVVFQPRKIQRAGIWAAVRGEVLIYLHKQQMLVAMQQRYPAAHYVMVDDKPQILADMKQRLGHKLTTVFVRQGHYAAAAPTDLHPAADLTIACIGDLRRRKLEDFLPDTPVISLPAG